MQIIVNGAGLRRPRRAQMVSVPLLAVATRAAASLPALLRRGGMLAAITTIGTALGPVAAGLCRGLGTSLGLPACEPAAESHHTECSTAENRWNRVFSTPEPSYFGRK